MSAVIMDGKTLAANMKEEIRRKVERMEQKPKLALVRVGDDPASQVYAAGKQKDCLQCGILSEEYILPDNISQQALNDLLRVLNNDSRVDGILPQFPLPDHLNAREVQQLIRPDKDVDCVNPLNMGRLVLGEKTLRPCTPAAVMRLLQEYRVDPGGRKCVIIGRSGIVGKPMAMLMLRANATVTICHTGTEDLVSECRQADILIAAAGRGGLITGDMIRPGAVVVDVTIARNAAGKLCGDVVFDEALEQASLITPVPGGVGPVTRALLMENTLSAAGQHRT